MNVINQVNDICNRTYGFSISPYLNREDHFVGSAIVTIPAGSSDYQISALFYQAVQQKRVMFFVDDPGYYFRTTSVQVELVDSGLDAYAHEDRIYICRLAGEKCSVIADQIIRLAPGESICVNGGRDFHQLKEVIYTA